MCRNFIINSLLGVVNMKTHIYYFYVGGVIFERSRKIA